LIRLLVLIALDVLASNFGHLSVEEEK
jgi:hypothetical protein